MRFIWLIFLGLAVVIGAVSWFQREPAKLANPALTPTQNVALTTTAPLAAPAVVEEVAPAASPAPQTNRRLTLVEALAQGSSSATAPAPGPVADSLVRFALRQLGTPYRWAGTTPEGGFDCSGFLMYSYAHVGVPVPHSTSLLINTGQPVPRTDARPGDLVVFTGTAQTSTTPGHAGIIISPAGEVPLRFVHSSSARRESGVKISQVEGTDYERRFMQVRRVLGGANLAASKPAASQVAVAPKKRLIAVVAPLEKRPAAVQIADETEPAPPKKLAPLPASVKKLLPAKAKASAKKPVKAAAKKPVVRKAPVKRSTKKTVKPNTPVKSTRKTPPVKKPAAKK